LWWSAEPVITLAACGWVEPMSVSPSRRRLLQVALLSPVVVACTSEDRNGPTRVDPDVAIRRAAIDRERALIERYQAAAASSSSRIAALVAPMLAEHEQHLAALDAPSPTPSATATTAPPPAVPTLAQLAAAERSAAAAHAGGAVAASRSLAAVLASLAASEASHAVLFG
jgi:hypothetical protein